MMNTFITEHEDIVIGHVVEYLSLSDIFQFGLINQRWYKLIFIEYNNFVFKRIVTAMFNPSKDESIRSYLEDQVKLIMTDESMRERPWLKLCRDMTVLKFDQSQTACKLTNNGRQLSSDNVPNQRTWESFTCDYPMKRGGVFSWRFTVLEWKAASNDYEVVAGCADRRVYAYNNDGGLVGIRDVNKGMGFNLGQWQKRIGITHNGSDIFVPGRMSTLKLPATFGFVLDYRVQRDELVHLKIYLNDDLLTVVSTTADNDTVYYPMLSACKSKTIEVGFWIPPPNSYNDEILFSLNVQ